MFYFSQILLLQMIEYYVDRLGSTNCNDLVGKPNFLTDNSMAQKNTLRPLVSKKYLELENTGDIEYW